MKKNILLIGDPCTGKTYLTKFIKEKNAVRVDGKTFYKTTFKSFLGVTKETEVIIIDDAIDSDVIELMANIELKVDVRGGESFVICPTIIATSNIRLDMIPNHVKEQLFIFQSI